MAGELDAHIEQARWLTARWLCQEEVKGGSTMSTYRCSVRVAKAGGTGKMVVWVEVNTQNPNNAKAQLEAQYGRSNVIGVPQKLQ